MASCKWLGLNGLREFCEFELNWAARKALAFRRARGREWNMDEQDVQDQAFPTLHPVHPVHPCSNSLLLSFRLPAAIARPTNFPCGAAAYRIKPPGVLTPRPASCHIPGSIPASRGCRIRNSRSGPGQPTARAAFAAFQAGFVAR